MKRQIAAPVSPHTCPQFSTRRTSTKDSPNKTKPNPTTVNGNLSMGRFHTIMNKNELKMKNNLKLKA